jgi:hypothetical protein
LFLAPGEARWNVHGCAELSLGDGEWGVAENGVVECFEDGYGSVAVYVAIREWALAFSISSAHELLYRHLPVLGSRR